MWSTYLLSISPLIAQLRQSTASTSAAFPDIRPLQHTLQRVNPRYSTGPGEYTMSVLGRRGAYELRALAAAPSSPYAASTLRPFSILNRPQPNYPGHVPLTTIERGALAIGSAIGSLINPRRAGMTIPPEPTIRSFIVAVVPINSFWSARRTKP